MYSLIRPLLFKFDAEKMHHLALATVNWLPTMLFKQPASKPVQVMGLDFSHPVGLAAGLDKNGEYLDGLAKLGFSFIEVGTVTPRAQPGNDKPRLFRLPAVDGIINRMGFNNLGVDNLAVNIAKSNYHGILGINIGKNKDTALNQAANDYCYCLRKIYQFASYVTINLSSPNTPGLRQLQQKEFFSDLLTQLTDEQKKLADEQQRYVPLAVKLSPDESDETLKHMADIVLAERVAAIIATNTSSQKEAVSHLVHGNEEGGLSGRPLFARSTHSLQVLKQAVGNEVTLIGVGGIENVDTAREKLQAGASLLQLYTGLIYQGPGLVSRIVEPL